MNDQHNEVLFRVAGVNGQIEVLEHKVRILRKGMLSFLTQGLKGDKEIMIASVTSVQFKKPGTFTRGYIQFGFSGGTENKGGIFDATKDENTVMFDQKDAAQFLHVKSMVEQKIVQLHQPATVQVVHAPVHSEADEIEKLASLLERNLITRDEFDEKKRKILGLEPKACYELGLTKCDWQDNASC